MPKLTRHETKVIINELFKNKKEKLDCQVNLKLTRKTVENLASLAKLNNTSVSEIIRIAIENLLDNIV